MTMRAPERIRRISMEEFGFGPVAMQRIKKCPRCGSMEYSGNEFCQECGSRLAQTTLYDFYKSLHTVCPDCDTVVGVHALYCPRCGRRLNKKGNGVA